MLKTEDAIALLEEIHELMNLKGENVFKVRAFEKAAVALKGHDDLQARAKAKTLTELPGIGKGISEVLTEFFLEGKSSVRDELKASLPSGLAELASLPGVGPKKAMVIIEELGIHTLGELEYACRENRLVRLKGFGEKSQTKILESIAFRKQNEGKFRIDEALATAARLATGIREKFKLPSADVIVTGALRRNLEIVDEWNFLVKHVADKELQVAAPKFEKEFDLRAGSLKLIPGSGKNSGWELLESTGPAEFVERIRSGKKLSEAETEDEIFRELGRLAIPPECRETENLDALFSKDSERLTQSLIQLDQIRGVFHMHTTRSDGSASLEDMVIEAKRLGYEYVGVSDHSQTAFYAQGLKVDALEEQEKEIKTIQEKHPEIKIFWGIESDILQDGQLDYDEKVLRKFDFVIASVHSRFQMDKKSMTDRILKAIQNPYTRFIGHLTGRIILGRKPYELDVDAVIEEASRRGVAIELNAHPSRLDIDWRHGTKLRTEKTMVSINPDAHEVPGLSDTRYGVMAARKALLPKSQILNTMTASEVEVWLKTK